MMELWGAESCTECKIAKMMLQKTPLEWKYVDVATIKFEGQIPMLIDDGLRFIGIGQIRQHVTQKLSEMGF